MQFKVWVEGRPIQLELHRTGPHREVPVEEVALCLSMPQSIEWRESGVYDLHA